MFYLPSNSGKLLLGWSCVSSGNMERKASAALQTTKRQDRTPTNKHSPSRGNSMQVGARAPGPQLCSGAPRSSSSVWLQQCTTEVHWLGLLAGGSGPVTRLGHEEGQVDWHSHCDSLKTS